MIDWLVWILALAEARSYAQKLPGKFTAIEDLVHTGVTNGVLREMLQHRTLVGVDYAFQNLTTGRVLFSIPEVPFLSKPRHLLILVQKWVVLATLLPLWRLDRVLVLVVH